MSNVLEHHGILGQKWGVRRTPAQLGHVSGKSKQDSNGASRQTKAKKNAEKAAKSSAVMSDDELRQRINRLNMEEQYANLVARQKTRNTGTVKKLLGEAMESLGRKTLGVAIDKIIEKISNKGDKFDINDWKNVDVDDMDADTIQKFARYCTNAKIITAYRSSASADSNKDSSNSGSGSSSNGSNSRSDLSPSSPSQEQLNQLVRKRRSAMKRLGTR